MASFLFNSLFGLVIVDVIIILKLLDKISIFTLLAPFCDENVFEKSVKTSLWRKLILNFLVLAAPLDPSLSGRLISCVTLYVILRISP